MKDASADSLFLLLLIKTLTQCQKESIVSGVLMISSRYPLLSLLWSLKITVKGVHVHTSTQHNECHNEWQVQTEQGFICERKQTL